MNTSVQKASAVLQKEKADALLVWNSEGSGQPATGWLSGFTGTFSVTLITRTKRFLITDGRYAIQSRKEAKGFSVSISSRRASHSVLLVRLLKRHKITKVIFDGSVTAYDVIEHARTAFPQVVFISRARILQELRISKNGEEVKRLTQAADISCRAFRRLIPLLCPGLTEKEIAERLEELCFEEGAEEMAFPTIVASGKNGTLPHAKVTDKSIQPGELVTIDFGVRYRGYVSDVTRTLAVGKVGTRLLMMYEAVRKAQELGCKKAKAGVRGKEIDAVCRNYLTTKGLGGYFTHSTGHGIGVEVHELPIVSSSNDARIPAGSVITCEPGVYLPGIGGVRIEDSLVVTKTGCINLTASISKKLIVL